MRGSTTPPVAWRNPCRLGPLVLDGSRERDLASSNHPTRAAPTARPDLTQLRLAGGIYPIDRVRLTSENPPLHCPGTFVPGDCYNGGTE
jgi:hypothetical protein